VASDLDFMGAALTGAVFPQAEPETLSALLTKSGAGKILRERIADQKVHLFPDTSSSSTSANGMRFRSISGPGPRQSRQPNCHERPLCRLNSILNLRRAAGPQYPFEISCGFVEQGQIGLQAGQLTSTSLR
jgi:hypothetical protein